MALAVIGGSGLKFIEHLQVLREHRATTSYGAPSAPIRELATERASLLFLSRHGVDSHLPPHAINYRANICALAELGVSHIVTVNIVGGIHRSTVPASWVVPDQLIDYTWGRAHSFYDGQQARVEHIDFSQPFDQCLSAHLLRHATAAGLSVRDGGTYGCTQGPRLETAAEIRRLQRDGCDIVGMTAMPEAALARERGISYAALCLVVNWAPGIAAEEATLTDMMALVGREMPRIEPLFAALAESDCADSSVG